MSIEPYEVPFSIERRDTDFHITVNKTIPPSMMKSEPVTLSAYIEVPKITGENRLILHKQSAMLEYIFRGVSISIMLKKTSNEFKLLDYLAQKKKRVLPAHVLVKNIKQAKMNSNNDEVQRVRDLFTALRKKLKIQPNSNKDCFITKDKKFGLSCPIELTD